MDADAGMDGRLFEAKLEGVPVVIVTAGATEAAMFSAYFFGRTGRLEA